MKSITNAVFCYGTMASRNLHMSKPLEQLSEIVGGVAHQALPALIIPGGTGHIGSHAVVEAVKRGWEVFPCSRVAVDPKEANRRVKPVVTPYDALASVKLWYDLIKRIGEHRPIAVFNCIGNPDATDIEAANVKPAFAIAKAVKQLQSEGRVVVLIQASSMAVSQLPDFPYGRAKGEAEKAILATDPKGLLILRIGYAVDGVTKGTTFQLNTTHAYDAPHLVAGLIPGMKGIVPIIGNGQQKFQPVAIKDIVDAVLNFAAAEIEDANKGVAMVDGIGREVLTQYEFYKIYADLIGIPLKPVHIEPHQIIDIAREFPMGHLSEYAVEGLARLMTEEQLFSAEEFEKLLRRESMTVRQLYANPDGQPIVYARPPVGKHLKEIVEKICKCPKARKVLFGGVGKILPIAFSQIMRNPTKND